MAMMATTFAQEGHLPFLPSRVLGKTIACEQCGQVKLILVMASNKVIGRRSVRPISSFYPIS